MAYFVAMNTHLIVYWPPLCTATPQPGYVIDTWRVGWYGWQRAATTSDSLTMVKRCLLVASLLQHMVIALVTFFL